MLHIKRKDSEKEYKKKLLVIEKRVKYMKITYFFLFFGFETFFWEAIIPETEQMVDIGWWQVAGELG